MQNDNAARNARAMVGRNDMTCMQWLFIVYMVWCWLGLPKQQ